MSLTTAEAAVLIAMTLMAGFLGLIATLEGLAMIGAAIATFVPVGSLMLLASPKYNGLDDGLGAPR